MQDPEYKSILPKVNKARTFDDFMMMSPEDKQKVMKEILNSQKLKRKLKES